MRAEHYAETVTSEAARIARHLAALEPALNLAKYPPGSGDWRYARRRAHIMRRALRHLALRPEHMTDRRLSAHRRLMYRAAELCGDYFWAGYNAAYWAAVTEQNRRYALRQHRHLRNLTAPRDPLGAPFDMRHALYTCEHVRTVSADVEHRRAARYCAEYRRRLR